jgi:DNA invertase Pin-like site-specific DNA recombinase
MNAGTAKPVRCAIYTRVSTDQGLDQDFNSLDAQHGAAEAYIRSQTHAAWTLVRNRYDDGGFSGGSTDRPALQCLLADVRARKVDIIVVYKVDRLTRSLADFAKLVELFDGHGVSFVSVTQQFNTTTSMGRLTLNVLLSFAQFEREVTSERIRDKIGASKRKGLWVGGKTPLGYRAKDRKIVVVEKEAELVRAIFRGYLKFGSIDRLANDLKKREIVTTVKLLKTGKTTGGNRFTRGPLSYLLRNRFYIGQVVYKGEILPGPQTGIVDIELFNAVQARLIEQQNNHTKTRAKSEALLIGRVFDDRGNLMSPSHTRKQGIKYRYYISRPLLEGRTNEAGSVNRIPAAEIENIIGDAVRREIKPKSIVQNRDLMTHVTRVEIQFDQMVVELKSSLEQQDGECEPDRKVILIPWQKPPSKRRREIILPACKNPSDIRPIRTDARARLVVAIARGRKWLDELATGAITGVDAIAARERCSVRRINMTISLAFLAPGLVKAAIEGRLPRGIGIARLCDPPADWSDQYRKLGLTSP